jgi:hypothetical protein
MWSVIRRCEYHIENDRKDGGENEDLKHEVVKSGPEELEPGLRDKWRSVIVSKMLGS